MATVEATHIDENYLERLLGLESSKIGFYAEVKQKIRELEAINLDLRTKKNELQAVFDAIRDGVAIFDTDRRVQFRNHVCPRLFPGETILGKTCSELLHPERRHAPGSCPVEGALRGEAASGSFSLDRSGSTLHLEVTVTPIRDPFGRPSRALTFFRDVTERKLQEMHLLQAEKMSSVGVLAAGVAHEINNPLTSVAGYAEGLLRRFRDEPGLFEDPRLDVFPHYLEVVVREAYRCKSIIDSLLSFSRKSDGSTGPVDLSGLVQEVLELLRHRARYEDVEIRDHAQERLPRVQGDAAGLRQVILNLTMNALQAIEGRGRVDISLSGDDREVTLRISDTGCGIPKEMLDQIWDPFFTTKSVGQGLGLGLAVTYNIVQRHGGHIRAESREGAGSTFTIQLPALTEAP